MSKRLPPVHPGEVLREEFLVLLKLSAGALARKMDVPRTRIERIAEEKTGITADTALRLSKALGTTPQLWLNLQTDYDLQIAHLRNEVTCATIQQNWFCRARKAFLTKSMEGWPNTESECLKINILLVVFPENEIRFPHLGNRKP
jgi:antitoxin HigA-1